MKQNDERCADCGEYPVNHRREWLSAILDTGLTPVNGIFERVAGFFKPRRGVHIFDRAVLPSFRAMKRLGFGVLKTDADEFDSGRNRCLFESAVFRGIRLHHFRFLGRPDGVDFFLAEKGSGRARRVVAFEGLPRPERGHSKSLDWMDNKAILKKRFVRVGIPIARGRACSTYRAALRTMNEVGTPVIAKPHIGSRSRHTTVNIATPETLRRAFHLAQQLSPWVIIEQQLKGYLFRILLVSGKVASVVRREPPHVIGDGVSTVRELVEKENKNPRREGPRYHHLPTDVPVDWNAIPRHGEFFQLDTHVSRYYGGTTTDFTDRAHPDNVALFEHIAATLDDSLVGVDFIMSNIERSWRDQDRCGVIECNSLPNIDLHQDVFSGENRDIAGMLLDAVFYDIID